MVPEPRTAKTPRWIISVLAPASPCHLLAAAQASYRLKAAEDPYLALIYARCPVDKWVGVKTHRLNELWTVEGAGGNFSWFLQRRGAAMVLEGVETNGYGVFKLRSEKAATQSDGSTKSVKDTWITFSGPTTTIQHPSYRNVPFNTASDSDRSDRAIDLRALFFETRLKPGPTKAIRYGGRS